MHPFLIERIATYLLFSSHLKKDNNFTRVIFDRSKIYNKDIFVNLNSIKHGIINNQYNKSTFYENKFFYFLEKKYYFDFYHEHY